MDTDVEMVDPEKSTPTCQKPTITPATLPATGSKTLFMGNLSFEIEEKDVRKFFQDCGEIVSVRFSSSPGGRFSSCPGGGRFKGFGRIEFATAEVAQEALKLDKQKLLDRPIALDLVPMPRVDPALTPRDQVKTAYVSGFDTSLGKQEITNSLIQIFESCGKIKRLKVPTVANKVVKGMAFIDFTDSNAFNKALGKHGTILDNGYRLTVKESKPRGDRAGGSGGRFDRGGRSSGGRSSGGRSSGGRDRGGRFGGRGGRFGGSGGRTAKPGGVTAITSGKITFDDD